MNVNAIRSAAGTPHAAAIVVAALLAGGPVVAVVAVVATMLLSMLYQATRGARTGDGPRAAARYEARSRRRQRR